MKYTCTQQCISTHRSASHKREGKREGVGSPTCYLATQVEREKLSSARAWCTTCITVFVSYIARQCGSHSRPWLSRVAPNPSRSVVASVATLLTRRAANLFFFRRWTVECEREYDTAGCRSRSRSSWCLLALGRWGPCVASTVGHCYHPLWMDGITSAPALSKCFIVPSRGGEELILAGYYCFVAFMPAAIVPAVCCKYVGIIPVV